MQKPVFKHKYTLDDIDVIDKWCAKYEIDLLVCYYPSQDAPSVEYKYCHDMKSAFKTLYKLQGRFLPKGYAEVIAVKNNTRTLVFYQDAKKKAFYMEILKLARREVKQ